MTFFEQLARHQQQHLMEMTARLDAHFAKKPFSAHQPISYHRLGTHLDDLQRRREEAAFHYEEVVALHSAIFDLPDIAFQGDDAIVGLVKRYAPERKVSPDMIVASYTFMQWLGTHVGKGFIRNTHEAFIQHDKLSSHLAEDRMSDIHQMLRAYFDSPTRSRQRPLNASTLGLSAQDNAIPASSLAQSHYPLLALSTYLDLEYRGVRPDTRNTFDYNMDANNGIGAGSFFAEDDEQATAMTLVAWLGTPEGAAHLRFLDAHRIQSIAA